MYAVPAEEAATSLSIRRRFLNKKFAGLMLLVDYNFELTQLHFNIGHLHLDIIHIVLWM